MSAIAFGGPPPDAGATDYDTKQNAAITSDHTGGLLDFIRQAILSLQHFAEQTNDDQELAKGRNASSLCSRSWPTTRKTRKPRQGSRPR